MEQENQQSSAELNDAVSAAVGPQAGLEETHQSGEAIIEGARTDDQLQQFRDVAGERNVDEQQADSPEHERQDNAGAGDTIEPASN